MDLPPSCPKTHILRKTKCLCVKKKDKKKKSPKTKKVKLQLRSSSPKKILKVNKLPSTKKKAPQQSWDISSLSSIKMPITKKKPRCRRGFRRSKITGECEKFTQKKQTQKKSRATQKKPRATQKKPRAKKPRAKKPRAQEQRSQGQRKRN